MSSLVSQENKELLWSLLAEEGLFDGIPDNVTPEEIKLVFERILKNLSATIPSLHAAKLKELHHAKRHAIAEEDYDSAKKIRTTIDEMEAPLARLDKLEARKALAIQAEDYEAAKQIKMEIDRIRAASFSLKELNKIAIESLAVNIPKLARDISALKTQGTAPPSSHRGVFPHNNIITTAHHVQGRDITPKEIYNAEDFQYQKRQEVEMKMREKEAEMRSYFEVPRPKEIDFSDIPRDIKLKSKILSPPSLPPAQSKIDDEGGDSPLADNSYDMDKMIAERIASRQRDLDDITAKIKASMPPEYKMNANVEYNPNDVRGGDDTQENPPIPPIPTSTRTQPVSNEEEGIRRVRFQDEEQLIQ